MTFAAWSTVTRKYSDGKHSVAEMVHAAESMGMKYITITDHSPTAFYAGGVKIDRLQRQWEEIERVQEQTKIKILKGTESDILADGSLDYPDWILEQFDVIVASIHSRYKMNEDQMTRRIVTAMRQPVFKIWGHALGRKIQERPPFDCRGGRDSGCDCRIARGHRNQRRSISTGHGAALVARSPQAQDQVRRLSRCAFDRRAEQR